MGGSFDGATFNRAWAIVIAVVVVLLIVWAVARRLRQRSQEARELSLALTPKPAILAAPDREQIRHETVRYARPAEQEPTQAAADEPSAWRRFVDRLLHPLRDRTPSGYSSLSPRNPDGSRTKPFYFNGSGKGR